MPPVTAQLVLQIDTPTYTISEADFLELKKAVGTQLANHVPASVWTSWTGLSVPSHQPTGAQVRTTVVDGGLKDYNDAPGQTWELSLTGGDGAATPLHTQYRYDDGERICECVFALDVTKPTRPLARWEASYTNSGGTTYSIGINARISWSTPWTQ